MFYHSALKTIVIPESVETIERAAFCGCENLSSFEIPARVKTIEEEVFCYCRSLTSIEIPANVKTIGDGAFSMSALTSIKIPTNVETIGNEAFSYCESLTSIEILANVKTIGNDVFSFCKSLKTVDMSACTQVETIGQYAFYKDSELRLFKIGTGTPPTCWTDAFKGINPYSVLKVPSGCADAYKAASGWKNFASITGLDE